MNALFRAIIVSLLDTDLYKFTMWQVPQLRSSMSI